MELTTEQISRVFAMYIGCDCEATDGNDKDVYRVDSDIIGLHQQWSGGVRLRLRTIDQITDAEAIEVAKIIGWNEEDAGKFPIPPDSDISIMGRTFCERLSDLKLDRKISHVLYVHQYLISIGIAVPLWFGIDHPLNGKTAIEAGIAIQQPSTTV